MDSGMTAIQKILRRYVKNTNRILTNRNTSAIFGKHISRKHGNGRIVTICILTWRLCPKGRRCPTCRTSTKLWSRPTSWTAERRSRATSTLTGRATRPPCRCGWTTSCSALYTTTTTTSSSTLIQVMRYYVICLLFTYRYLSLESRTIFYESQLCRPTSTFVLNILRWLLKYHRSFAFLFLCCCVFVCILLLSCFRYFQLSFLNIHF